MKMCIISILLSLTALGILIGFSGCEQNFRHTTTANRTNGIVTSFTIGIFDRHIMINNREDAEKLEKELESMLEDVKFYKEQLEK